MAKQVEATSLVRLPTGGESLTSGVLEAAADREEVDAGAVVLQALPDVVLQPIALALKVEQRLP